MSPAKLADAATEIVFAFVAPLGANLKLSEDALTSRLKEHGYEVARVHVTYDVLPKLKQVSPLYMDEVDRIETLMNVGTEARGKHDPAIIARGVAAEIAKKRLAIGGVQKTAYLVHTLKHPAEVRFLRELYPRGFYLIGVNVPEPARLTYLSGKWNISEEEAKRLMLRDRLEDGDCGQRVNDTFHLADFFVGWADEATIINHVHRFVDIVFGDPHRTPTFGEFAMFMAFAASVRSADLSRQVGAVISKKEEILSTGANDSPKNGGGLYWPFPHPEERRFVDHPRGRDYMRGGDSNKKAQIEIIEQILGECSALTDETGTREVPDVLIPKLRQILQDSRISDLTEFGRVVHAEMEALLSCARRGISTVGASVYCTTFPCHNCAKHIIAAGIKRVIYVEPYLKSKAEEFHDDSIRIDSPPPTVEGSVPDKRIPFVPFFGVGPRRFIDLFSMTLGVGYEMKRKEKKSGDTLPWTHVEPRTKMFPFSYLEAEREAAIEFAKVVNPEA